MKVQKSIYEMSDRELRAYKRRLRRQREIRRRCMMIVMTFCLIVVCAISYHSIQSNASTNSEDVNFKYYTSITVKYGESLWDIADEYIDYEEYKNKNEYIAEVQSINHLEDTDDIRYGQILIIPYFSSEFVK
ncbi:MAG: LysM peptidoglycan-binding domain-containing protein [Lachnospiraceae bacterium]|nr:LysM peptidoglycan-binding domain-containing protein [Lachnospiraceae bacterium]